MQFCAFLLFALVACNLRGDETLVVASIRQYRLAGLSNVHLYLYGLNGTIKKQLTDTVGCDDIDPSFTYDGKSIYFTRKSTIPSTAREVGLFELNLASGRITRKGDNETYVSVPTDILEVSYAVSPGSWNTTEKTDCTSPDGVYRITQKPLGANDPNVNPPMQHLLSVGGQSASDIATFTGFPADIAKDYYALEYLNGTPFLTGLNFAAIVLLHHLNSTAGNELWALDLQTRMWSKLSQNGGLVYHPPGAPGLFCGRESRYEPLGSTGLTVNCCYLEWWDNHLKKTSLTPPLSVFYSAAIFHPAAGSVNPANETLTIGE